MTATRLPIALLAVFGLAACASDAGDRESAPEAAASPPIERITEDGPVTARVTVTPAAPRLGDPVTLTLSVTAARGIVVEMPAFGEALGRFSIVRFTPSTHTNADGATAHEQTYVLQPPMSGKQRLPPLRVEYVDTNRDAETAIKELLTDEIALEVESVLTDEALAGELRPARARLEPARSLDPLVLIVVLIVLGAIAVAVTVYLVSRGRKRDTQRQVDAYAVAMDRLERLAALPEGEAVDAWYVALSAAVRAYIEDRYRIRAPELTTEEFLSEARRVADLTDEHRALLSEFLAGCDRVKFAGHRPGAAESGTALETARQFVEETRLRSEPVPSREPEPEEAPRRAA
jgi:hypothetical protein